MVIRLFSMALGIIVSLSLVGDRTYKLPPITTSEYGRYVKSLGEPRGGPSRESRRGVEANPAQERRG